MVSRQESSSNDAGADSKDFDSQGSGNARAFRLLFPLLDSLDAPWPVTLVFGGMVLEGLQLLALVFNPTYAWGPVMRGVSLPIYFTILPLWDQRYVARLSFVDNTILFWVLFAALLAVTITLAVYLVRLQSMRNPHMPLFFRGVVYVIIGPLFLPCLHNVLSMLVCDGGHGGRPLGTAGSSTSTSAPSLTAFADRQCFVHSTYPLVTFGFAIVAAVMLVVPKYLVTLHVYDDYPLTTSPRGRSHSMMEGWMLAFQIVSAVLHHFLPAVGQRETFASLLSAGAFCLAIAHCFTMPFFAEESNRIRVVLLACLFYCALVLAVSLSLESRSILYTGSSDWDSLVIVLGVVLMCLVGYHAASFRVSKSFRRDLRRAEYGLLSKRARDGTERACGRGAHHSGWRFPYYLPNEERCDYSEADIFAQVSRETEAAHPLDSRARMGGPSAAGASHGPGSSRPHSAPDMDNPVRWGGLASSPALGCADEMEDVPVSSYIDAVYTDTDVELATRFLAHLVQVTSLKPSRPALCFAARIYTKGMSRFLYSDWLRLRYAIFLATYSSELNPVGIAICTEVGERELSCSLAYRLHRHIRLTDTSFLQSDRASRRSLQRALSVHKETLVNINNFWKQLELDQVGVSQLGNAAFALMDGCRNGANCYVRALRQRVDTSTLLRYAQFLDHVALDHDAAENVREIAADLIEKRQAGLLVKETPLLALRESGRPSSHYSRNSRSLRRVLAALCSVVLLVLLALLVVMYVSHQNDVYLLDRTLQASSCRFFTLRTLWTVSQAMVAEEASTLWGQVRADLAELREANARITYQANLSRLPEVVFLLKRALYVLVYGPSGEYETMGLWRAGEVYISALESLILAETSPGERAAANSMVLANELTGAASAYNASVTTFVDRIDADLRLSTIFVTALFTIAVSILLIAFFVLRCHLARIGGTRLSVLGLFRLIPRNALRDMMAKMNDHVEYFGLADPVFERMLRDRGLRDEATAAVGNVGRPDGARTSGVGGGGGVVSAEPHTFTPGAGGIGAVGIGSALREGGGSAAPGATIAAAGAASASATSVSSSSGSRSSTEAKRLSPDTSGGRDGMSGHSGRTHGDALTDVAFNQTHSGDMFAKLAKSSSVADVGRLRFHQGQYEAPYDRDAYTPRPLSREELRENQRVMDDILVDEVLHQVSAATGSRSSADAALRAAAEGEGGQASRVAEDAVARGHHMARGSTRSHQRVQKVLSALCIVFAIVCGAIALRRRSLIVVRLEWDVLFQRTMQLSLYAMRDMLDAAETLVYAPNEPSSWPNLVKHLNLLHKMYVTFTSMLDSERSPTLAAHFGSSLMSFQKAYQQALAAALLTCWAQNQIGLETMDCRVLNATTWTAATFIPTNDENVLFDTSLYLPRGKEEDIDEVWYNKMTMAKNVITSSYYRYLKTSMLTTFLGAKSVHQTETLGKLSEQISQGRILAQLLVVFSSLLALTMTLQTIAARMRYPERTVLVFVLVLGCLLSYACLALACVELHTPLPEDGPYQEAVRCFVAVESIYRASFEARDNVKLAAFGGLEMGALHFETSASAASMNDSWVVLLNLMGGIFVPRVETIYTGYQYYRFLQTIAVVLSCAYNTFSPDICALPRLANFNWNLDQEAFGYRTRLEYAHTSQLLYSTRMHDLNEMGSQDQVALARSLVFGPMYTRTYGSIRDELLAVMRDFAEEQVRIMGERSRMQDPVFLAVAVMAFVVAAGSLCTILVLTLSFAEAHYLRAGLRTTAGSSIGMSRITDNSFRRVVRHTALALCGFAVLFIPFYAVSVVSFESGRGTKNNMDSVMLRNAQLLHSAVNFHFSIRRPWYINTATDFADRSVATAESYYWAMNLKVSEANSEIFGSAQVSFKRYDRSMATNDTVAGFALESPVLAFGGLVDLSQRRWRHRLYGITVSPQSTRREQSVSYSPDLYRLSNLSRASSLVIVNGLHKRRNTWFRVALALYFLTLASYVAVMWYLLFPVVHRLIKEEEGTQVMLRMIPPEIRNMVPTIAEYLVTGRIVQDANIAEVDAVASEFSVLPTIVIDIHGFITHFSRAAEETFQWSAVEVVGQNVSILMPENLALEHDGYLRRYMRTGTKRLIGTSRTMRARRKDGSLFPAIVQIREVRACETSRAGASNVIAFVGVVRSCQEEMELERTCRLATSLTDSINVPVIVSDRAGVIVKFSKAAENVFRCSAADVVGRKVNVLMPRAEAEQHDAYIARYLQANQRRLHNASRFVRGKRMNGETFPAQLTLNEVRSGGTDYFIGYVEDLSERLHLEIMAAVGTVTRSVCPVPLVVADAEGRMVFCSSSVGRLFGYSSEELAGQSVSLLMDESLAAQHRAHFGAYVRRNRGGGGRGARYKSFGSADRDGIEPARTVTSTARRREQDGSYSTFTARVTMEGFLVDGKGTHVLAFIEDVSRKQTLQTKSSIGRFITAFSALPVLLMTQQGTIADMNYAAELVFGCALEESYGLSINALFRSADEVDPAKAAKGVQGRDDVSGPRPASRATTSPLESLLAECNQSGTSLLLGRKLTAVGVRRRSALETPPDMQGCERPGQAAPAGGPGDGVGLSLEATMLLGSSTDSFSRHCSTFPVELVVRETLLNDGRHFLIYARDASRDRKLLEASRWSDAIMSASAVPVVCASADDGIIFSCSDSLCAEFRWSREELLGQHIRILMSEDAGEASGGSTPVSGSRNRNLAKVLHALDAAREQRMSSHSRYPASSHEREVRGLLSLDVGAMPATTITPNAQEVIVTGRTRDGEEFPMSVLVQEVFVDGSSPFFVASLRNCKAAMALTGQRNMSQALAEQLPIPFLSISATGIITEFSRAAEERFGYTAKEVEGQNVRLLMPDEVGRYHDGYLRSYAKTRVKRVVDNTSSMMARRKDGTFFLTELLVREVVYRSAKDGTDTVEFVSYSCDTTETTTLRKTLKIKDAVAALASAAMLEVTLSGSIVRCNDLVAEEFGASITVASEQVSDFGILNFKSVYDIFPRDLLEEGDAAASQGSWLEEAVAELDALAQQASEAVSAAPAQRDSTAPGGSAPTVTRVLLGRRQDGESLRCAVTVSFGKGLADHDGVSAGSPSPSRPGGDASGGAGQDRPTQRPLLADAEDAHADTAAAEPVRTLVLHIRNLTSDSKLRLHQELFLATAALMPDPLVHIDAAGTVLFANRAVEEVLGFPAVELVGHNVAEVLSVDSAEIVRGLLDRFRLTGIKTVADVEPGTPGAEPLTLRVVRRGGASVVMRATVRGVEGVQGGPSFLCSLTDLSTPIAAAAEQGLTDVLTRDTPVAAILTDHRGTIMECSAKAASLLQVPAADLAGRHVSAVRAIPLTLSTTRAAQAEAAWDFFAANMTYKADGPRGLGGVPDSSAEPLSSLTRVVEDRVVISRQGGGTVRAQVRIFPTLPPGATLPHYVAYMVDVEQALVTEPLAAEAGRVLDATPGAVLVVNRDGIVERANAAAAALLRCDTAALTWAHVGSLTLREGEGAGGQDMEDPAAERGAEDAPLLSAFRRLVRAVESEALVPAVPAGEPSLTAARSSSTRATATRVLGDREPTYDTVTVRGIPLRCIGGAGGGADGGVGNPDVIVDATLTVSGLPTSSQPIAAASLSGTSAVTSSEFATPRFIVISMRDVTQIHLAREVERKEAALEDVSLTAMVELDADGVLVHISGNLARRLGYGDAPPELLGRPYSRLFLKGDAKIEDFLRLAKSDPQAANAATRQHVFYLHDRSEGTRRKAGEMRATLRPDGGLQSVLILLRLPRATGSWLRHLSLPAMTLSTEAMLLVSEGSSGAVVVCSNEAADRLFRVPGGASLVGTRLDAVLARSVPGTGGAVTAAPLPAAAAGALFPHLRRHATGKRRTLALLAVPYALQLSRLRELVRSEQEPLRQGGALAVPQPSHRLTRHAAGGGGGEDPSVSTGASGGGGSSSTVVDACVPVEVSARELSDSITAGGEGAGGSGGVGASDSSISGSSSSAMEPLLFLHIHSVADEQRLVLRKRAIDVGLDFAFHATVVVDATGSITLFSRVAEKLFGIPKDIAKGREMFELLLEPASAAMMRQVVAVFRHRQNPAALSTPRIVTINTYGTSVEPDTLGSVVSRVEAELVVELMPSGETHSLHELVAFFIAK